MRGKTSRGANNAKPRSVPDGGQHLQAQQLPALVNRPQSCPKLGDFASLRSVTVDFKPTHHILSKNMPSRDSLQLGDFSRIVDQLREREASPPAAKPSKPKAAAPTARRTISSSCGKALLAPASDSEAYSSSSRSSDARTRTSVCTAASSATESQSRPSKAKVKLTKSHSFSDSGKPRARVIILKREQQQLPALSSSQQTRIFTYELPNQDVIIPVYDNARTIQESHESLSRNLIPYCATDRKVAQKFPSNALHGVHIFLDMSNIEISFQTALRKRYSITDGARYTPMPRLNLRFLTELLVRGRASKSLHVSCSILPGRKEPRYVQELRDLGYRADVRERKRVENGVLSSPSLMLSRSTAAAAARYVEDLVDETLQTRIAEAVMEHFQEQGTIVLATGDAKPAQYSDGFLRYVERALRMGWNVDWWPGTAACPRRGGTLTGRLNGVTSSVFLSWTASSTT
ncbi:hypothetical protein NQ176_g4826 [Zarea fungicola]|uniref:Uncharacterized protein n=1 Tax=Zarea fungicola TaxID=93591 RepID=A0ACC1NBH7_9HYPO|nr:hypothetical protein NQ176_g4826 [Lecanicillium fungicola]